MIKNPLEKDIEKKVSEYAKSTGWLCYKFKSPGHNGVPDRLLLKKSFVLFIEFKRKGGKLRPSQDREISRMVEAGASVFMVDNCQEGKKLIDELNEKLDQLLKKHVKA